MIKIKKTIAALVADLYLVFLLIYHRRRTTHEVMICIINRNQCSDLQEETCCNDVQGNDGMMKPRLKILLLLPSSGFTPNVFTAYWKNRTRWRHCWVSELMCPSDSVWMFHHLEEWMWECNSREQVKWKKRLMTEHLRRLSDQLYASMYMSSYNTQLMRPLYISINLFLTIEAPHASSWCN